MHRPVKTAVRRALPLIAAVAALGARPAVADDADADARRRLFEEAPAAWKKLEAYADNLVVEGVERFPSTDRDRAIPIRYVRAGESSRFEFAYRDGGGQVEVIAPDACFSLRRESASSPYRVEFSWPKPRTTLARMIPQLVLRPPASGFAAVAADCFDSFARGEVSSRSRYSFASRSIAMPFSTGDGQPFARVLNDPEFRIKSVAKVSREGRDLVKVDFEFHPTMPSNFHAGSGWWLFDPARLWTLQSSEFVSKLGQSGFAIDYGDDDEAGFPSIRRTQIVHLDPAKGDETMGAVTAVFEVTAWRRNPAKSEFQLSSFGIINGDGVPVASNSNTP